MQREIFVAPEGADWWTGTRPDPAEDGHDGPIPSLRQAVMMARQWHRNGLADGPVIIRLGGGRFPLTFPLEVGPEDYGVFEFRAAPGAEPVIDGGVPVRGWAPVIVNERQAWAADMTSLLLEFGPFRSLFVNGARCRRARYPAEGYLWIEEAPDSPAGSNVRTGNSALLRGSFRFRAAPGDLDGVQSWQDAEVVMLNRWINERMPVASYDAASRILTTQTRTRLFLKTEYSEAGKTIRYWIDNVREGLLEPGDWYLDTGEKRLYYLPLEGQDIKACEVVVPVVRQFLRIRGELENDRPAGGVAFRGITFRHADWCEASTRPVWWDPYAESAAQQHSRASFRSFVEINNADPHIETGSSPQAAVHLPGSIQLEGARNVTIEDCRIEHVGFYGIGLGEACRAVRLLGNTISDMGGGGVIVDGMDVHGDPRRITGHCHITDNLIHGGGQVFPAACGITLAHSVQNVVAHNEIHDMTYSGISCGWLWGLCDSVSRLHWIYKNHIHDLGRRGGMSDMGGIYLLGPQPGTFIENNYIHDIQSAAYGGWGIYPDEGSSLLTIEKNVVVRTGSDSLHEHMGRQNVIRNNLFLLGGEGGVRFSRSTRNRWQAFPTEGGLFFGNIVVTDGAPVIHDFLAYQERNPYRFDLNVYWDSRGKPGCMTRRGMNGQWQPLSFEERRAAGLDLHSVLADPRLKDAAAGDFAPTADSPARALGFEPVDLSDIGPRPRKQRIIRHEPHPYTAMENGGFP
ncbi:MAG: right-handed parallel beta-helix repeat-containing protein [Candidatus Marinimicrobia bacterium]|nr:right-handed parallel beta-helix repeat-containing protein [Candidatus Neomarinimicrobiota bacterium]